MNFQYLKDYMDKLTEWKIPGNTIVIYQKNKEIFRYSSGYRDVEKKIPMQGDELLNIYSCSKITTVVAALQLLEKGCFCLDDALAKYLPEFKDMYVKTDEGILVAAKKQITIKDLFTMTAGFDYDCECKAIKMAESLTEGRMDTVKVAKALAMQPLNFEPGSHWCYSLCHDVLAAVVEVISGERFSDYVQEHIFKPLEIEDAHYHTTPQIRARMAQQYQLEDSDELVNTDNTVSYIFGEHYDSGGAGITVSIPQYAKLGDALANGGIGATGRRILENQTIELMRTNQLSVVGIEDWYREQPQFVGYGYGLGVATMIDKAAGKSIGTLGEFGWTGAAGGMVLVDPERHMSYFYASHMLNSQVWLYQGELRNVVYSCLNAME